MSIQFNFSQIACTIASAEAVENRKARCVAQVGIQDPPIDIKLVDLALNAGQTDRLALDDLDENLIRQNALYRRVSNPVQLFDMHPYLAEVDTKDICADLEAGVRKNFALP